MGVATNFFFLILCLSELVHQIFSEILPSAFFFFWVNNLYVLLKWGCIYCGHHVYPGFIFHSNYFCPLWSKLIVSAFCWGFVALTCSLRCCCLIYFLTFNSLLPVMLSTEVPSFFLAPWFSFLSPLIWSFSASPRGNLAFVFFLYMHIYIYPYMCQ